MQSPLREVLRSARIQTQEFAAGVGVSERTGRRWLCELPASAHADVLHWARGVGLEVCVKKALDQTLTPDDLPRGFIAAPPPSTKEEETMEITSREFLEPEELAHFGLAADPFDDAEDPEDVYLSPRLQAVERALNTAIQRRQIVALVGDPGSGKSTLLRRLYGRCAREQRVRLIAPASLDRRRVSHAALGTAILRDLIQKDTSSWAMEPRSELLRQTLADQVAAGLFPVLLIDEAHLLRPEALLAIKHLWDSHTLFRQLAVLMVGQMPLASRLKSDPALRELTGRTRILPLGVLGDEVGPYLRWRFARVGSPATPSASADQVFDASAIKALGVRGEMPLWVNNAAVLAMRYAHRVGDERVTANHVGRS